MKRIVCLLMIFGMCIGLTGCNHKSIETAEVIFEDIKSNKEIAEYIVTSKVYNEEDDPNGIMNMENQYTSKVAWEDKRVQSNEEDAFNGGSIELFKNESDAALRKEYYEYYSEKMSKTFTSDEYGNLANSMLTSNRKLHQKGNALIILNASLQDDQVETYFDLFDEVIGDYEFEQIDVLADAKIKELSAQNLKELDEGIETAKTLWDEQLTSLASEFDEKVVALEDSLTEADVSKLEKEVEDFNIPFFIDKYNDWITRISTAKTTIADNKKAAAEQAAAERAVALGNENALKKANSYLKSNSFSYTRLISQLEYEGFTNEQATYAVDNCGADWSEQAAKKANSYMKSSSFSRPRLIDQLLYEGFTYEQAEYGVTAVGY